MRGEPIPAKYRVREAGWHESIDAEVAAMLAGGCHMHTPRAAACAGVAGCQVAPLGCCFVQAACMWAGKCPLVYPTPVHIVPVYPHRQAVPRAVRAGGRHPGAAGQRYRSRPRVLAGGCWPLPCCAVLCCAAPCCAVLACAVLCCVLSSQQQLGGVRACTGAPLAAAASALQPRLLSSVRTTPAFAGGAQAAGPSQGQGAAAGDSRRWVAGRLAAVG